MRKLLVLVAIVLACAPAGFAQQDYANWEFFIGYAHERASNGGDRLDAQGRAINANGSLSRVDFHNERVPYHGVTGEVVANVHRYVGLVTNVSATWAGSDFQDRLSGREFEARMARYTADFENDDFTCPDTNETAFAMALGAGLDIRANDRIDIRPIQVDYLPVFFDNRREDGVRFSAGVKIKN